MVSKCGRLRGVKGARLSPPRRLTLSEARILKEAMTCSAVSVSAVSRVMKSMKAWKVTTPVLLASTRVMMRANSTSPCREAAGQLSLKGAGSGPARS